MTSSLAKSKIIFNRFYKANPTPTTELLYDTPFELLIAVMLSAQATDKSVNKITRVLFRTANTPTQILSMGEDTLKQYISSINFYVTKAKHIIRTCELLTTKYQSTVPNTRIALESLPGVGRKTANVMLNIIFKKPQVAVDTHIFRVCNRTGLAVGKTPFAVEMKLVPIIPKKYKHHAHHWLVLHGRYICKARVPDCSSCILQDICDFKRQKNIR